jgi:hypothetical protein
MFFPTGVIVVRFLIPSMMASRSGTLRFSFSQPPDSSTESMILRPKITSRAFLLRSMASVATAAPAIRG